MKPLFWRRYLVDPHAQAPTVWSGIEGCKVNIKEIEDRFQEKKQPGAGAASGGGNPKKKGGLADKVIQHIVAERIRPYFTPDESRRLAMNVNKLPSPEALKAAVANFDESKVTTDQIRIMVENWPKTPVADLEKEELGANEKWDKPELYMKQLARPPSIHGRLIMWKFKAEW